MDWLNGLWSVSLSAWGYGLGGAAFVGVLGFVAVDPFGGYSKLVYRVERAGHKRNAIKDDNWKATGKVGLMSLDGSYQPAGFSSKVALFAEDARISTHETGVTREERRWRLADVEEARRAQKQLDGVMQ